MSSAENKTSSYPAPETNPHHYPTHEGEGVIFPLEGEALTTENSLLLRETISAPEDVRQARYAQFPVAWHKGWRDEGVKDYFQTMPHESPFAKYSSQGWKLHVAFEKGREEEVSRFLYGAGLYFKTQARMGSWFNGLKESGSTVYVGSWDCMQAVASHLTALEPVLTDGPMASAEGKTIHAGSNSDIEFAGQPKITARFDVQKSPFGLINGDKKYGESGLPSWMNIYGIFSGLPILYKDAGRLAELEHRVLPPPASLFPGQPAKPVTRKDFEELLSFSREAQLRARQELIHDFGAGFVLGKETDD